MNKTRFQIHFCGFTCWSQKVFTERGLFYPLHESGNTFTKRNSILTVLLMNEVFYKIVINEFSVKTFRIWMETLRCRFCAQNMIFFFLTDLEIEVKYNSFYFCIGNKCWQVTSFNWHVTLRKCLSFISWFQ